MNRRGFQLIELAVGLALVAFPLTASMGLIQTNVRIGRSNQDRAAAREILVDLSQMLLGESLADLRALARPGADLDLLLAYRVSVLPDEARESFGKRVACFKGKLRFSLDEGIGKRGALCRMVLKLDLGRSSSIQVSCVFRPGARPMPPQTSA